MSLARFTVSGEIRDIPPGTRVAVFEEWLERLTAREYVALVEALNARIDRLDVVQADSLTDIGEIGLAVYEPVWSAMGGDTRRAAKFLGLIVWQVMSARPEAWLFHKIETAARPEFDLVEEIQALEYFRAEPLAELGEEAEAEASVT